MLQSLNKCYRKDNVRNITLKSLKCYKVLIIVIVKTMLET